MATYLAVGRKDSITGDDKKYSMTLIAYSRKDAYSIAREYKFLNPKITFLSKQNIYPQTKKKRFRFF